MLQSKVIIPSLAPSKTATSLLLASTSARRFSSSCAALDALLTPENRSASTNLPSNTSSGLAQAAVLELLGPPGIGKTRSAMSFILGERFGADNDEQASPSSFERHVLVVDAEGSLSPTLLYETAELYANHNGYDADAVASVCSGIHYRRIYEASLLIAFLYSLPTWLTEHKGVSLIVLDSLSSHLRPTSMSQSLRAHLLSVLKTTLHTVTSHFNVSFILTSYMSLKLYSPDGYPTRFTPSAEALLVPQLPVLEWLPADKGVECRRIVMWYDEHGERCASIVSSTDSSQARLAEFTMDALGPCDHPPFDS